MLFIQRHYCTKLLGCQFNELCQTRAVAVRELRAHENSELKERTIVHHNNMHECNEEGECWQTSVQRAAQHWFKWSYLHNLFDVEYLKWSVIDTWLVFWTSNERMSSRHSMLMMSDEKIFVVTRLSGSCSGLVESEPYQPVEHGKIQMKICPSTTGEYSSK